MFSDDYFGFILKFWVNEILFKGKIDLDFRTKIALSVFWARLAKGGY